MKDIALKSFKIVLFMIFTISLSKSFAAGNLFCASIFLTSPKINTDLVFESVVYSPIHRQSNTHLNVDRQLHHQSVDLSNGETRKWNRRLADFQNDDFSGFLPTSQFMQTQDLHQGFGLGLKAFSNGAGRRVTPEENLAIQANDRALFDRFINSQRLGYAFVSKPYRSFSDPHAAFIRVYDGTDYSSFGIPGINGAKLSSSPELPTEISMKKNNIKINFFESYRKQGYQIFQIGKYVLSTELTPVEKKAVRNEIFKWLLENYLDPAKMLSSKVAFVINVDSLAHEKTYRKLFGTTVVEPTRFDPPVEAPNAILVVELQTLRQHLLKIIAED